MTKICDSALIPPLNIIFSNIMATSVYPAAWEKANAVPVHKKESKNLVKHYRAISLLPILGKHFEKCVMTPYSYTT